jgi:hypothetical protein
MPWDCLVIMMLYYNVCSTLSLNILCVWGGMCREEKLLLISVEDARCSTLDGLRDSGTGVLGCWFVSSQPGECETQASL